MMSPTARKKLLNRKITWVVNQETGCWEAKHRLARARWLQENGDIPKGLWVLHSCDNPFCINLKHLYLGDNKDNMQDMWIRGRHP